MSTAISTVEVSPKVPTQGLVVDQFLYFYLRLRKSEIRRVVQRARSLYPEESPEQLARRLINTQSVLSFFGGSILHLPQLLPAASSALKFGGFAGGTSVMTRMHLYLILEIALLFGYDIDDQARVKEMAAVVAASGISAAAPFMVNALGWHPLAAIPTSGLSAASVTQLVGNAAIKLYSRPRQSVPRVMAEEPNLPRPQNAHPLAA